RLVRPRLVLVLVELPHDGAALRPRDEVRVVGGEARHGEDEAGLGIEGDDGAGAPKEALLRRALHLGVEGEHEAVARLRRDPARVAEQRRRRRVALITALRVDDHAADAVLAAQLVLEGLLEAPAADVVAEAIALVAQPLVL